MEYGCSISAFFKDVKISHTMEQSLARFCNPFRFVFLRGYMNTFSTRYEAEDIVSKLEPTFVKDIMLRQASNRSQSGDETGRRIFERHTMTFLCVNQSPLLAWQCLFMCQYKPASFTPAPSVCIGDKRALSEHVSRSQNSQRSSPMAMTECPLSQISMRVLFLQPSKPRPIPTCFKDGTKI